MRRHPAVILSYLSLAHVFPVNESHLDERRSLLGLPIKAGYNSCYVITNKKGHVFDHLIDSEPLCDEIVISQENQALSAFIITLDPISASKEYENWQRQVVTPRSDSNVRIEI